LSWPNDAIERPDERRRRGVGAADVVEIDQILPEPKSP
jgi:hypothetical protein